MFATWNSATLRARLYFNNRRRDRFLPPITQGAAWAVTTWYQNGDTVSYSGSDYLCIQTHQAIVGREPDTDTDRWSVVA